MLIDIDIAVAGPGGMAVSRPDPIIFNDAIRTTHVENSMKILVRSR